MGMEVDAGLVYGFLPPTHGWLRLKRMPVTERIVAPRYRSSEQSPHVRQNRRKRLRRVRRRIHKVADTPSLDHSILREEDDLAEGNHEHVGVSI